MQSSWNQTLDSCESTNTLAKQWGEQGAPHGTWVSARVQTGGRGRQGREWISREGNLFLSIIVRPEKKALWTWIPLITALGVVDALRSQWADLEVQIKWPNDLWIDGRKLGGILCEGVGAGAGNSFIVIGLGLNCVSSPQKIDQETISLSEALGQNVDANRIRNLVTEKIIHRVDSLKNIGIDQLIDDYERFAVFSVGSDIAWSEGRGVVLGLGQSGEMKVINERGEEQKIFAEEVRRVR